MTIKNLLLILACLKLIGLIKKPKSLKGIMHGNLSHSSFPFKKYDYKSILKHLSITKIILQYIVFKCQKYKKK
jgi:hypothetical protein